MEQHTDSLDQDLDKIERLPTGFFPAPADHTGTTTSTAVGTTEETTITTTHKRRVIVVAYDHSNYGDAMIAKSIRLDLLRTTDDIRIVHIVNQMDYKAIFTPMISDTGVEGNLLQDRDLQKRIEYATDNLLYEIISCLKKHGFQKVSYDVLRGDPKESITDYCRISRPIYLLTGTRGFGTVKRTMLGSVSNFLTRHCPCPVLIVKMDPSEIEARKEMNDKKQASFNNILDKFSGLHTDGPVVTTTTTTASTAPAASVETH